MPVDIASSEQMRPRHSLPAQPLFPDVEDDVGIGVAHIRRSSFSYHRLPEPLIRLSIRKLDDSSFDVQIARSASVWELKLAIEDVFRTRKDGDISWAHVWGHFSLCYGDEKLTDDTASVRTLGIRDGDQLRFVRNLSTCETPVKRKLMSLDSIFDKHRMSWVAGPEAIEEHEGDGSGERPGNDMHSTQHSEEKSNNCAVIEDHPKRRKFKLGRFLRRLFSHSKRRKWRRTNSSRMYSAIKE